MSKTDELDELFQSWISLNSGYKDKFSRDGITDEDKYDRANIKILFIAKEPNNPKDDGWDYRVWWKEELKFSFSRRLSEWAYGCLNGFPMPSQLPDDEELLNALQSVAFMNLKKIGGGSLASISNIEDAVDLHRDFLLKEINIINPDLVIGGVGQTYLWNKLFGEINFIDSGFDINVAKVNNFRLIDFYHPSAPCPRAMSYCLLSNIMNSDSFINL